MCQVVYTSTKSVGTQVNEDKYQKVHREVKRGKDKLILL